MQVSDEDVRETARQAADLIRRQRDRITELEAALRRIAAPTYGTEIWDTDEERAAIYARHLEGHRRIAVEALSN